MDPVRNPFAACAGSQSPELDVEGVEKEAFNRLRAELAHAFAAPESSYMPLTAAEVIARNRD